MGNSNIIFTFLKLILESIAYSYQKHISGTILMAWRVEMKDGTQGKPALFLLSSAWFAMENVLGYSSADALTLQELAVPFSVFV